MLGLAGNQLIQYPRWRQLIPQLILELWCDSKGGLQLAGTVHRGGNRGGLQLHWSAKMDQKPAKYNFNCYNKPFP